MIVFGGIGGILFLFPAELMFESIIACNERRSGGKQEESFEEGASTEYGAVRIPSNNVRLLRVMDDRINMLTNGTCPGLWQRWGSDLGTNEEPHNYFLLSPLRGQTLDFLIRF